MPMQLRLDHLERVAEKQEAFPPWRVTVFSLRTGLIEFTYYTCGRCSLKERDCPTKKPEQRDQNVPIGVSCVYCGKEATKC